MKFRNVEFNDGHLRFQFVNSQEAEYDPAQEFFDDWHKLQNIQKEKERREKEREKFLKKCEEEINAEYEKSILELERLEYLLEHDMNYIKTLENDFLVKDTNDTFYLLDKDYNVNYSFSIEEETSDAYIIRDSETKKIGVLDKEYKIIIPIEYLYIRKCESGYIVTSCWGEQGAYNKQGKEIIPLGHYEIEECESGYIVTNSYGNQGAYNKQGKMIIPHGDIVFTIECPLPFR